MKFLYHKEHIDIFPKQLTCLSLSRMFNSLLIFLYTYSSIPLVEACSLHKDNIARSKINIVTNTFSI